MNTVTTKNTKAQILCVLEAYREALDQERQAHASSKRDLEELRALRAAAVAKAARAEVPRTGPDRYCVTEADGSCVSTDPRCMHNVTPCEAPKSEEIESQEPSCEAPSAKPMTIKEFCAEYCRVHGTRSVPGDVVKAWRDSFKCRCGKCGGTGEYGNLGVCYACQGTGEQTVADVARNRAYRKLNAPKA